MLENFNFFMIKSPAGELSESVSVTGVVPRKGASWPERLRANYKSKNELGLMYSLTEVEILLSYNYCHKFNPGFAEEN